MRRRRLILLAFIAVGIALAVHHILVNDLEVNPVWIPSPGVTLVPSPENRLKATPPNSAYTEEELRSDNQIKILQASATQILARLKKTYAELHLSFVGPDQFQPVSGRVSNLYWDTPKVELNSKEHSFTFQKSNNELSQYMSNYFFQEALVKNSPLQDVPFNPVWTEDQAAQIGAGLLQSFFDTSDFILTAAKAKYDGRRYIEGPKFRAGTWTISWGRIDGKGHSYSSDGARIEISEKWGVISAVLWRGDTYVEQKGNVMSADIAVAIAKASHPAMGTPSNDIVSYSVKSSELMIVEPYEVAGQPSRLAWVICYNHTGRGPHLQVTSLATTTVKKSRSMHSQGR